MRSKGDELETQVAYDLSIKKTNNSGARYDNADLANQDILIECKYKSGNVLSGPGREISKLKSQAIKHCKEWLYIQKNDNTTYAIMDYNFFLELWTNFNHGSKD